MLIKAAHPTHFRYECRKCGGLIRECRCQAVEKKVIRTEVCHKCKK